MRLDLHQALVPLTTPVPLRLHTARGTRVRSLAGTLWVTVDGEQEDHILERGESLVIDSDAPVLVSPLHGTATVGLSDQPEPAPRPVLQQARDQALRLLRRAAAPTSSTPQAISA